MIKLDEIFNKLWMDYTSQNPSAQKVVDLFSHAGEKVLNDHIAFRTFDHPKVNIGILARPFLENGYEEKGAYTFEAKHLFAKHFEHKTDKDAPRVFISQLKTRDFSSFLQKSVTDLVEKAPEEVLQAEDLILAGNIWGVPSYDTYLKLREESEYAAWVYVYGFRANHFTVSINALQKYNSIEKVNQFLKDNGFLLNTSGGEIKGTKEDILRQSSIMANPIDVEFREGKYSIPGCYYEFAQRYPDQNGNLYSGFIAKSADKIFESTNYYDKNEK
ncbi:MAG: DUF1338 domain-containing protein [Bacteroidales bacterium]|jgi:hypothetical protein|nr:DUF1338 domain-containing protein [Bacteroidales bacterium]